MRGHVRSLLWLIFFVGLGTAAYALRGESFDDSVRLLVEYEQYVDLSARSIKLSQESLPVAIGCRRAVRLVDRLERLDRGEACERSAVIYERSSQALRATTERIFRSFEDKNAPQNTESLVGDNYAVCVGLYCIARHCGPHRLVQELRALDTFARESTERAWRIERENPSCLARTLEKYFQPDNACQVSLLMQSLQSPEVSEKTRAEAARLVSKMFSATGKPRDRHGNEVGRTPFTNYSWDVSSKRGGCGHIDHDCQRDLVEALMRLAVGEEAKLPVADQ